MQALETDQPTDFAGQVQHASAARMLRGHCSNEVIAAQFGAHRHKPYRRLAAAGCTSEQLLEQSRQRLATRMLQETDMPVSEIASMLGYAAQGNFTRAFAPLIRPPAECVAKDAADERWPQRNARAGQQVSAGRGAWPE